MWFTIYSLRFTVAEKNYKQTVNNKKFASCVKDANFFCMIETGIKGHKEQIVTPEMSAARL